MKSDKRILITGITGFIGTKLREQFIAQGFEVWGISRKDELDHNIVLGDLSSSESTAQAFSKIPDCPIIVHAAALAHSSDKTKGQSYFKINTAITENLVNQLKEKKVKIIFLSSIAVYGSDGRSYSVTVNDEKRPASEYGLGKLKCEEAILNSGIKDYYILRPAPVFDDDHMTDLKKRVYFPGINWVKMVIKPSPGYSFCHINTLLNAIFERALQNSSLPRVVNVTDPTPYNQNELAKKFDGIGIIIPGIVFTAIINLLNLLPFSLCYTVRCFLAKLFKNNIYK
jgi:nucleoside-diphosphate-sugar epimerase